MFIKEVFLEGFKSYSTRTVLSDFDPHFNAITGLNGSGKSNILDAICFVLGITNLSQVRVGSLQELIYKQCQAGINKASVTIVFDNSDPQQSPVGYEQNQELTVTRQVIIGGRNKYLINGKNVQAGQVQNLFHSVQLNVNNPHFLIMQGRITKVLNMKPQEILGMVEEAAGTRMFETKKQAAIKTIEKKQTRVAEIEAILDNEISPQLDKLRSEREGYLRWSANNAEMERLDRCCIAFEYLEAKRRVENSESDLAEMKEEIRQLADESEELKSRIESKTQDIRRSEAAMNDDDDSEYQVLKKRQEHTERDLIKATSNATNKKESLHAEKDLLKKLSVQLAALESDLSDKLGEMQEKEAIYAGIEQEAKVIEDRWRDLQGQYEDACAGISQSDESRKKRGKRGKAEEEEKNLLDAVGTVEEEVRQFESSSQQVQLKLEHALSVIREVSVEINGRRNDDSRQETAFENLKAELRSIESSVDRLGYDDDQHKAVSRERIEIVRHVNELRGRRDRLETQLASRTSFDFQDPVRGFDRSKVKGMVAKLISVAGREYATALEVAAGPRLFQVVVDNEQTGKAIIDQGRLQKRVTIIPLNKISHPVLSSDKQNRARRIAAGQDGQAQVALELVGFDDEVRNAMEYVFGSTFVCSSSDIAKQVAFSKDIQARTVSLEGDVFDPSGTMTGGSNQQIGVMLNKLFELSSLTQEIVELEARLQVIDSHLQASSTASVQYQVLMTQKELKEHEIKKMTDLLRNTAKGSLRVQLEEAQSKKIEYEQELEGLATSLQEARSRMTNLKSQNNGRGQSREGHLTQLQRDVSDAKIAFTRKSEALKDKRSKLLAISGEVKGMQKDKAELEEQTESARANIADLEHDFRQATSEVERLSSDNKKARDKFEVILNQRKEQGSRIQELEQDIETSRERVQVCASEIKRIHAKIGKFQKEIAASERNFHQLRKSHAWISRDEEYFDRPGTEYDFGKKNMRSMKEKLDQLQVEQDKIGKKINKKVMGMIEKVETEYRDLIRKKDVIENDKTKIEQVIQELDVKKIEALNTTWVKVNHDFGNIFSTLLPGTSAKLDPPEGMEVVDGLEVKVAFGSVWKESLTELSGGQRSLLALSLILSLLLFKPAPVYILDEVDAALDLSHTQNIGTILRTHFTHSQFIVVSLKEGMFNNANVVFRTRFIDGISTVTRTVGAAGLSQRTPMDASEGPFFKVSSHYEAEEEVVQPVRKRRAANSKNADDEEEEAGGHDDDDDDDDYGKETKKPARSSREKKPARNSKQNQENDEEDDDDDFNNDEEDDDEDEVVVKKKKKTSNSKKAAVGRKRGGKARAMI